MQESENEVPTDVNQPCWRRIAGVGFLLIIIKNLVSGCSDVLVGGEQHKRRKKIKLRLFLNIVV